MKNKNLTLALFALIFSILTVAGQQRKREVGLHAGLSYFNIKNFVGDNFLTGLTTGIFVIQPISKHLELCPEINYQMQGSKTNFIGQIDDMAGIRFDNKYRLNYLNIPLLITYRLADIPLRIYAGPQVGFLLSARLTEHPKDYESITTDIRDNLNTVAFSGVCGASVHLPSGKRNQVIFDARFASDFTHLDKGHGPAYGKSYGFSFMAGYSF